MKNILIVLLTLLLIPKNGMSQINSDSLMNRSIRQMKQAFQLSDSTIRLLTIAEMQRNTSLDSLKRNPSINLAVRTAFMQRVVERYEGNLKEILSVGQWSQYLQKKALISQRFLAAAQANHMTVREITIPN